MNVILCDICGKQIDAYNNVGGRLSIYQRSFFRENLEEQIDICKDCLERIRSERRCDKE